MVILSLQPQSLYLDEKSPISLCDAFLLIYSPDTVYTPVPIAGYWSSHNGGGYDLASAI